jgi:hypothetical protein
MTAGDPLTRARALQKSGDQRAAIAAYHEALRAGAPAAEANLQLGVIHAAMGEHGDAIRHLQVVLAEQPAHADALCVLGTVLYDQGRYGEATRPLEEALRLRPGFAEALFNLGLVRFETGDLRAAAACIGACSVQNRGAPWEDPAKALANDPQLAFSPRDMAVNPTKLRHDCEQIEYLLGRGLLPALYREVLADYRALLAELGPMPDLTLVVPFDAARHPLVARTYKRPIHVDQTAPPSGPLINPALDDREISRRYLLPRQHHLEQRQSRIPRGVPVRRLLLGTPAAPRVRAARASRRRHPTSAAADDVGLQVRPHAAGARHPRGRGGGERQLLDHR